MAFLTIALGRHRETSRVSFLMCPFCVRAVMPKMTTHSANRRPLQGAAGTDYYCDNDLTLTQPS
jgi:hypothetical protein